MQSSVNTAYSLHCTK